MSTQPSPPRTRITHPSATIRIAVLAAVAALSLGACTAGQDDGSSAAGGAAPERAARDDMSGATQSRDDGNPVSSDLAASALQPRAIERHGTLELRSEDVGGTRDDAVAAAHGVGGYTGSEHSTAGDDGDLARVSLQLVVPTDEFDSAMNAIAHAGTVESRRQSANDVTDEVVDVDSRVKSAEATLKRVRLLLDRAGSLGDVIRLESVLAKREADLEALQARQRSLAARTSTATIDLVVRATPDRKPVSPAKDDDGFLAGLSAGWDGLRTIGTGLATALGAVLPFAVVIAVAAVPIAVLVRRLRRRRPAAT